MEIKTWALVVLTVTDVTLLLGPLSEQLRDLSLSYVYIFISVSTLNLAESMHECTYVCVCV